MGVGDQREVDPGVGNQVSLELCQIHVKSSVKSKRGCDGGYNLTDEPVEVGISGSVDVQIATADVIDGLVVDHESTVRVFKRGVSGQDGVVRLHHCSGHLRCGVNSELQFGLHKNILNYIYITCSMNILNSRFSAKVA